jgi:collagen type III alpha
MQLDARGLAEATADIVRRHVTAATDPLVKRIEALENRPSPERGEKGDMGDPGRAGEQGRDGVGLAGALIDRSGVLVLTLTDGTTRELGVVVGKDGETGPPGERGEQGERGETGEPGNPGADGRDGGPGEKGMDGRDGADGKDGTPGRDGFNLEDFDIEAGEDGRTVTMKFQQGETRHSYELVFPVTIYRDVFKAGETYQPGDAVTWGGSLWIAQQETKAKPDGPDSGWRLAVKKGRDGKDAKAA